MDKKDQRKRRYQFLFDYWNSNREEGFVLAQSQEAAQNQQEKVLVLFIRVRKAMAAWQVIDHLFPGQHINDYMRSYARAVTNLKREGYLIKKGKDFMIKGHDTGSGKRKMVHVYELNENAFEQPKGQMEMF